MKRQPIPLDGQINRYVWNQWLYRSSAEKFDRPPFTDEARTSPGHNMAEARASQVINTAEARATTSLGYSVR